MSDDALQVWFMPWAGLGRTFTIGPVTFWPFPSMAEARIRDQPVREHLDRYFRCYVDHSGKTVDTITVCSHESVELRRIEPNEPEAVELRGVVDALLFSVICSATKAAVCADNKTMAPPSADRYQLLRQNFTPGDEYLAVTAGSAHHIGKIPQVTFQEPWCLGGGFGYPPNKLIQGFQAVFDASFPSGARQRLFRSLEWFRLAHTQYDEVSDLSKIVMMATAFEILLEAGKSRRKKEWIACELERRCARPDSLRDSRAHRDGTRIYSKVACWGWDFYDLRNNIAHGDEVAPGAMKYSAPGREWLTHLIVADLVFWECVLRELYGRRCIGQPARDLASKPEWKEAFPDMDQENFVSHVAASFLGFNDVHRTLGWLPKLASTK